MRKQKWAVLAAVITIFSVLTGTFGYADAGTKPALQEISFTVDDKGSLNQSQEVVLQKYVNHKTITVDFQINKGTYGKALNYKITVTPQGELFENKAPVFLGLQRMVPEKNNVYVSCGTLKKTSFTYELTNSMQVEKLQLVYKFAMSAQAAKFKDMAGKVTIRVEAVRPNERGNYYGINTLIFDADDIDMHLDWAHSLVGDGGYIRQMFGPITKGMNSPPSRWSEIIRGCYERNMIPVVRLTAEYIDNEWAQPQETKPNDYSEFAQSVKKVFEKLPLKQGMPIYVEVLNEVNLALEWGGEKPDPVAYGHLLVDVSKALRSLNDPRIRIVTAGLAPVGNYNNVFYDNLQYLEDMFTKVPESLYAFDVLGSHPYPGNHPPEYNIHNGTAKRELKNTIDGYMLELKVLEKFGRKNTKVILTETGYELGNGAFSSEGYAKINEELRTDYSVRTFRDYWSKWPEVLAACPYELSSVQAKNWSTFDWVDPYSSVDVNGYPTLPYPHYKAVAALKKPPAASEYELQNTQDRNMEPPQAKPGNIAGSARAYTSTSIEDYGWGRKKINNNITDEADLGWTSNGDANVQEWVVFDFKEKKEMQKVILYPRADSENAGKYFPQEFSFQVSDDNLHWQTIYTYKPSTTGIFNPGSKPQTYTFTPATGRYFRLLITKKTNNGSGGYHAQLGEIEVY